MGAILACRCEPGDPHSPAVAAGRQARYQDIKLLLEVFDGIDSELGGLRRIAIFAFAKRTQGLVLRRNFLVLPAMKRCLHILSHAMRNRCLSIRQLIHRFGACCFGDTSIRNLLQSWLIAGWLMSRLFSTRPSLPVKDATLSFGFFEIATLL